MTDHELMRQDIKKKLNSYRELKAEALQLQEELRRLELLMGSPMGPNLSGMPRGSSEPSSPTERLAIKHIALEERYGAKLEKLATDQLEIEEMIERLEPTERRLARYRYIDGLNWEEVCVCMNYSWRQSHRIHGRMLDRLTAAELEKRQ